jgi:nitrate reductase gamma subunit
VALLDTVLPFSFLSTAAGKASGLSVRTIAAIVTGAVLGVVLVVAVTCFLLLRRTGRY